MAFARMRFVLAFTLLFGLQLPLVSCSGGAGLTGTDSKKKESKEEPKEPTDDEKENDDLRVIPPEIVSGAYLTCEKKEDAAGVAADKTHYACIAVVGEDKQRVDLTGFKKSWSVTNVDLETVPAKQLALNNYSNYDQVWELDRAVASKGLKAKVDLEGSQATKATLKTRGVNTIDGVEVP